ncbi:MAG: hypothetical protein FD120_721 [Gammaproteobacteria bacterium]|nr:MAG: hypothetical protein FD120_721 [Gammaproteobacteria bacterium]
MLSRTRLTKYSSSQLRQWVSRSVFSVAAILLAAAPVLSAADLPPIDWSGNVGYTYRSLTTGDDKTISNQYLGTLAGNTYIWRPWFAQVGARLTSTLDNTEYGGGGDTESKIATGELNLNLLPQSATPFTMMYLATDSRVDTTAAAPSNSLNSLVKIGQDFKTQRLGLTQAYITQTGHRYRAKLDFSEWDSSISGVVEDQSMGFEADLRRPQQRLIAELTTQSTERVRTGEERDSLIIEADHFYFPRKSLRVDTLTNIVQTDDSFKVASTNGSRETDQIQISSFAFWRPQDRPLTITGGVRLFNLAASGLNVYTGTPKTTETTSLSGTLGGFYQLTKGWRLDARGDVALLDSDGGSSTVTNLRTGALYQSDVHDLSGYTYQWFANAFAATQSSDIENRQTFGGTLSHDLGRFWVPSDFSTIRGSVGQSFSPNIQSGNSATEYRLDHTMTTSWNHLRWGGSSLMQAILQDSRNFGDQDDEQQFLNLQLSRTQPLSRLMSLMGNLTWQTVNQDFGSLGTSETETLVARLTFQHSRVAGIPRLRYLSDLSHSEAANDIGLDRFEWENRLDYNIGLVSTRLSWRMFDQGGEQTDLIYFQVTRSF